MTPRSLGDPSDFGDPAGRRRKEIAPNTPVGTVRVGTDWRVPVLAGLALVVWVPCLAGCRKPNSPEPGPAIDGPRPADFGFSLGPEALLAKVLGRYRAAASYRDDGRVTLRVRDRDSLSAGDRARLPPEFLRSGTTSAPMRLWYHRGDFYLEAYALRMVNDRDRRVTWIVDPASRDHDGQVRVDRPVSGRPQIDEVLADPVALAHVEIGLAGPPPQLEWLLADKPMKRLFSGEHQIRFSGYASIRDERCRAVTVVADGDTFEFWISMRTGVIARVRLPDVNGPVVPGGEPVPLTLTLDLRQATFETPIDTPQRDSLPTRPTRVRQFVPLPPPPPPAFLGLAVRSGRLRDPKQPDQARPVMVDGRTDRPITAVVNLHDAASPIDLATAVSQWGIATSAAPTEIPTRVVLIADRETSRQLPRGVDAPVLVTESGRDVLQHDDRPGVYLLDARGTIVWFESDQNPALLHTLGGVVRDLHGGVDLVGRIKTLDGRNRRLYAAAVEENREK